MKLLNDLNAFLANTSSSVEAVEKFLIQLSESFLTESKETSIITKVTSLCIQQQMGYLEEVYNEFVQDRNPNNQRHIRLVKDSLKMDTYPKYLDNPITGEGVVASEYFRYIINHHYPSELKKWYNTLMDWLPNDAFRFLKEEGIKLLPLFSYLVMHYKVLDITHCSTIGMLFKTVIHPDQLKLNLITDQHLERINRLNPNFKFHQLETKNKFIARVTQIHQYIKDHMFFSTMVDVDLDYLSEESNLISYVLSYVDAVESYGSSGRVDEITDPSSTGYTAHRFLTSKEMEKKLSGNTWVNWCVIKSSGCFEAATVLGLTGLFYVFLHKDYKRWKFNQYEPEDEIAYDLSMIAVAFGPHGGILSIHGRLNKMKKMTQSELEEITGISVSRLSVKRGEIGTTNSGPLEISPDGNLIRCTDRNLKYLVVPEGVTMVRDYAFPDSLVRVKFPSTLYELDHQDFFLNRNLNQVIFSNGIVKLGKLVFDGCTSLTSIEIPPSVKWIGESAFENCENLSRVILHEGLSSIGMRAFSGCVNLRQIQLPRSLHNLSKYSFEKSGLESIEIPENVVVIPFGLFLDCKSLKYVKLHDKVFRIDNCAFISCESLEEIEIPNSVRELDLRVFAGSYALRQVVVSRSTKVLNDDWFQRNVLKYRD